MFFLFPAVLLLVCYLLAKRVGRLSGRCSFFVNDRSNTNTKAGLVYAPERSILRTSWRAEFDEGPLMLYHRSEQIAVNRER